jgi:hypothetical protein
VPLFAWASVLSPEQAFDLSGTPSSFITLWGAVIRSSL